jgi:hypothetical protein
MELSNTSKTVYFPHSMHRKIEPMLPQNEGNKQNEHVILDKLLTLINTLHNPEEPLGILGI